MGRAIALGIVRADVVSSTSLRIADRHPVMSNALVADLPGAVATDAATACAGADLVLVCVKPKDVAPLLADLAAHDVLAHHPLLVSIAAGVSIASLESATLGAVPVVRAMPNTPCVIGKGHTVLARGTRATDEHLARAHAIFSSIGRSLTLDEKHLDAVTAVSASGPAFIYVIIEALADGGVSCGLPRAVVTEMVAQMTLGAAAMVLAGDRHPAALKDDVTTPGGCTIAGLMALEDGKIRSVIARAVETTTRVASGLGG